MKVLKKIGKAILIIISIAVVLVIMIQVNKFKIIEDLKNKQDINLQLNKEIKHKNFEDSDFGVNQDIFTIL
ncbi:MAG: hypothetical protein Q4B23_02170 [Helcococcus sp.]|nr:hypothetical protein [Helcococcus sp.]